MLLSLFTTATIYTEATQVPINRQVGKKAVTYVYVCICVIHTYIYEYYWAIKKKKILPFATAWMDLDGIMLSEIN